MQNFSPGFILSHKAEFMIINIFQLLVLQRSLALMYRKLAHYLSLGALINFDPEVLILCKTSAHLSPPLLLTEYLPSYSPWLPP